jgi:hypothetical protein
MDKSDILKINAILGVIARDEELIKHFALALGEDETEFGDWIEVVQIN